VFRKRGVRADPDQQRHSVTDNHAVNKGLEVRDWLTNNPRIPACFIR
jgi:hypothetical protein